VAKSELGTKRICPETGRKFYDLNKDPIVSPYTGHSYPRSYFETVMESHVEEEEEVDQKPLDDDDAPEIVSLEDADNDDAITADDDVLPDLGDDEDVDLGDDDDTFLEDEEDEDDVTGIIGVSSEDDER